MSMKVLVAGGAGFLGSHLCDQLIDRGHQVLCADNMLTGRKENIQHLIGHPSFDFVNHDVTSLRHFDVEGIFNLACPASPIFYQRDPVQTLKTSVLGALNLLELAKRNSARILQASTSEVYGDPEVSPQMEDYWGNVNPIGVRSCYDEGKRAAETLFVDYKRKFDVDIRLARIFNTFGPRMAVDDGRVVSNFITQALLGKEITIYGEGSQSRSFCYVSDLIDGLMKLFFTDEIHEPINLGNPESISVLDLAEEIVAITDSKSKFRFEELPLDDPKIREPNIEKAWKVINWRPTVSREQGLRRTIGYFRKVLS
jgi:UDP-glucuronate decarboxylase